MRSDRVPWLFAGLVLTVLCGSAFGQRCPRFEVVWYEPLPDLCAPSFTSYDLWGTDGVGVFAGATRCQDGPRRAIVVDDAGLRFVPTPADSRATDVNAGGRVVGFTVDHLGVVDIGWFWDGGDSVVYVPPRAPLTTTVFQHVNDDGLIAGIGNVEGDPVRVAFLYDPDRDEFTIFGLDLPGPYVSRVRAMAQDGTVVGEYFDGSDPTWLARPYIRHPDGSLTLPPVCPKPDMPGGIVFGFDQRSGEAYGSCQVDFLELVPVVWRDGDVIEFPFADERQEGTGIFGRIAPGVYVGSEGLGKAIVWAFGEPRLLSDFVDPVSARSPIVSSDGFEVGADGRILAWISPVPEAYGAFAVVRPYFDPGDLTCDRRVDFADLVAVLVHWGPVGDHSAGFDLSGDGVVDHHDLAEVLEHWTP